MLYGSFNISERASKYNNEGLVVTSSPAYIGPKQLLVDGFIVNAVDGSIITA